MRTQAFTRKALPFFLTSALLGMHLTAQAYDGVVIFGDSLSDGGTYGSRFTTNPGLTAAEYFAQGLGYTTVTSAKGGTNYAQGGARVTLSSPLTPTGAAQRPISTQISEYLTSTGGAADPNTVYFIQGGANDLFLDQTTSSIITAGTAFAAQIANLSAAGAKLIVVSNVPNLGATPAFAANKAGGAALSSGYNTVVQTALTTYGTDVAVVDAYSLINEVVASPSTYGFTNTTATACPSSSLTCTPSTLVSPDAASTYVFADGVHPTTATQKLMAQYMLSVVNAPTQMSLLSAAPLAGSATRLRTLAANMPHAGTQTWHTFVDYDHTPTKYGEAKSTANTFLAGVDRRIGTGRVGLSVGYQKYNASFGANSGGFDIKEPSVGLYYNHGIGADGENGNVLASLSYGDLKVSNLKRNISLGAATRTETGSTGGHRWSLGVSADVVAGTFANRKISHGPTASLRYEDIKLDAFDEAGSTSSAMSYSSQSRRGFLASLGYQLKGHFGRFSPYAKVTYEFDGTRGSGVRAHLKSAYSGFTTPALETNDGFRAEVGAAVDIAPMVSAHVGLGSTLGKSSGKETSLNIGVDAKF